NPQDRELLQEALRFYKEFVKKNQDNPQVREHMAVAHWRVAQLSRQLGQYALAEAEYGQALVLLEQLAAERPGDGNAQWNLAQARQSRAGFLWERGRHAEAHQAIRHC